MNINSLWHSDTIWHHGTGSSLVKVMACCLFSTSHYMNWWWHIFRWTNMSALKKLQWNLKQTSIILINKNVICKISVILFWSQSVRYNARVDDCKSFLGDSMVFYNEILWYALRLSDAYICICKLHHHWFREWLVAYSVLSHYLNQNLSIVNWSLGNKFQWNFVKISKISFKKITLKMLSAKFVSASMSWCMTSKKVRP